MKTVAGFDPGLRNLGICVATTNHGQVDDIHVLECVDVLKSKLKSNTTEKCIRKLYETLDRFDFSNVNEACIESQPRNSKIKITSYAIMTYMIFKYPQCRVIFGHPMLKFQNTGYGHNPSNGQSGSNYTNRKQNALQHAKSFLPSHLQSKLTKADQADALLMALSIDFIQTPACTTTEICQEVHTDHSLS